MPAFVVERREADAEEALARGGGGAVVALGIGQGHRVPDGRFDGVVEVLVAVVLAFVAVGQLDLGEEVPAEGLAAQLAHLSLLAVELRLHLRRQRRPGADRGQAMVAQHPGAVGHAEGAKAHQQQDAQDHEQHDQKRVVVCDLFLVPALAAASAPVTDRNQQLGFRRRRRGRWDGDHHHR